ncbi:unnamed protein product [Amoebophrya sp. A25]|nr:unnamed protein product [Amoebophrya sp. A25]|eukprot:GSA25T00016383001.1
MSSPVEDEPLEAETGVASVSPVLDDESPLATAVTAAGIAGGGTATTDAASSASTPPSASSPSAPSPSAPTPSAPAPSASKTMADVVQEQLSEDTSDKIVSIRQEMEKLHSQLLQSLPPAPSPDDMNMNYKNNYYGGGPGATTSSYSSTSAPVPGELLYRTLLSGERGTASSSRLGLLDYGGSYSGGGAGTRPSDISSTTSRGFMPGDLLFPSFDDFDEITSRTGRARLHDTTSKNNAHHLDMEHTAQYKISDTALREKEIRTAIKTLLRFR